MIVFTNTSQSQKTRLRLYVQSYHLKASKTLNYGQSSASQLFPLPSTSHRFHLKSSSIVTIPNLSITGRKLHLNPGQVLGSSQSLCSCRIFGHSRPPFDGCWMMRRFRNCFNFTTFPAEQRNITKIVLMWRLIDDLEPDESVSCIDSTCVTCNRTWGPVTEWCHNTVLLTELARSC